MPVVDVVDEYHSPTEAHTAGLTSATVSGRGLRDLSPARRPYDGLGSHDATQDISSLMLESLVVLNALVREIGQI